MSEGVNRDREYWIAKCKALMESNRVEVRGHRYTRPAPSTYEHQWLWDSCFHAIILRHFAFDMARDELLSLVAHQVKGGPDAGMIPHMAYWNGGGAELWGYDDRSIITQPPLIATAAMLVYEKTNDKTLLEQLYEPLAAYHQWFDRRRDPDNDGLVSIIHPWESGWDASPRWDKPMGLSANPSDEESRLARKNLVAKLIEYECDAQKLAEAGYFHVEAADFNLIRINDLEWLGEISRIIGKPNYGWGEMAAETYYAMEEKMQHDGRMFDLDGNQETRIDVPSAAEFVALLGRDDDLVSRLNDSHNWPTYPIPTTPLNGGLFNGDHYWRGNVWLNVNWLIWSALRHSRYNPYDAIARELTDRSLTLVDKHGFHEYFNPITGKGHGSFPHSWSAIVLDMLLTELGEQIG